MRQGEVPMKLCIADPPYLRRAHKWYGDSGDSKTFHGQERIPAKGDIHPEAHVWDDPETHRAMVDRLQRDYDGWAIAMAWDNLRDYLQWVPSNTWIGLWIKTNGVPGGSRLHSPWEPVLVLPPTTRRAVTGRGQMVRGVLEAAAPMHFVGAKPRQWTRWVLDMLGYDPETDTVDDLFHGSGAVANEIAQGVLL